MKAGSNRNSAGLVLSGGGARGAYETGILYYLFVDAPPELREAVNFRVLCGTSIGALSISALAANIHQPAQGMRKLCELWRGLRLEDVLQLGLTDVMSLPGWVLGRNRRSSVFPGEKVRALIEDSIDWEQIHVNLGEGRLDAVSLSCTQITTGKTVVFYETGDGRPRRFSRDPNVRPVHARLGPIHAEASAAIPFVFPSVEIDGIPYADGGLRQNTPLSPALRMGSERLLVVSLSHAAKQQGDLSMNGAGSTVSPVFVLAKLVNALMLDHVAYDLVRLGHVNRLLSDGEAVFGEQFIARLNTMVGPIRGAHYRIIPHLILRPSRDLGKMAAQYIRGPGLSNKRSVITRMLRTLARMENRDEADLTSYLLFEGGYCEQLMDLGIQDAKANHDQLLALFCEPAVERTQAVSMRATITRGVRNSGSEP